MNWGYITGLFFVLCGCSFVLTKVATQLLRRGEMLDIPNHRSSHTRPTPRGGGLAVIGTFLASLAVCTSLGILSPDVTITLAGVTLFLATVSWLDDVYTLGPLVRFGSHIIGVIVALTMGLVSGPFMGGLVPPTLEIILVGIGWVWFINLFNFMDGIDGIATSETIAIGLGGASLMALTNGDQSVAIVGLLVAAAALGFLPHNWSPAKIFLGDVGSIPLGFLCAWILLSLAAQGQSVAAFILSLVFLADATLTLFKRIFRREKFWQAHRQHFYQQAVQRGFSHAQVTLASGLANLALIGLAYWSTTGHEIMALAVSFIVILALFYYFLKFPVALKSGKGGS